jgi:hypothetical protein
MKGVKAMPSTTWYLRFTTTDCTVEEQEHAVFTDALDAFRLFADPANADIYTRLELIEHDWDADEDLPMLDLSFAF